MQKNIRLKNLWNSKEINAALNLSDSAAWMASGVSIDSRKIAKGDIFIAIVGPKFDGNQFTNNALEKGAAAAIVNYIPRNLRRKRPILIVKNTSLALKKIGEAARKRTRAKIITITGSVGKTTTKELLREILEKEGSTTATIGNLNNQLGLPLSLSRMPKKSDFGIFELGMNKPGEISSLTKITKPDIAIITNIEKAHLKFFKNLRGIALEKSEIFNGMEGGIGILNRDSKFYGLLKKEAIKNKIQRIVTFGEHKSSDVRLRRYTLKSQSSECVTTVGKKKITYDLRSTGKHWIINSLIILATALALKLNPENIAKRLEKTKPITGRGKKYNIKLKNLNFTLLDDSYNACPASMKAGIQVLDNMKPKANGRCIAILGDMLELGKESNEMHLNLRNNLIGSNIDLVFTSGKYMKNLYKVLPKKMRGAHNNNPQELARILAPKIRKNDIIFVKGSNGTKMFKIVETLKSIKIKDKK